MKFSVATISLPNLHPDECIQEIRDAGFAGVEWRVEPRAGSIPDKVPAHPYLVDHKGTIPLAIDSALEVVTASRSAGLEVVGLGPYVELGDTDTLELVAEMTARSGVTQFRLQAPRMSRVGLPYGELFARTKEFFAEVEECATRHRVKALLEIHHNTICSSAALAYRLLSDLSPAHVGAIYDVGNLVFEGYEAHQIALDLLGPYLAHVHLKNAAHFRRAGGGWDPGWTPLEDGEVDILGFVELLEGRGYEGWASIEDISLDRSPSDTLRHNAAQLREWGLLP